jgi:hypothetical protein
MKRQGLVYKEEKLPFSEELHCGGSNMYDITEFSAHIINSKGHLALWLSARAYKSLGNEIVVSALQFVRCELLIAHVASRIWALRFRIVMKNFMF